MATIDFDVLVNVFQTNQQSRKIGMRSNYTKKAHPGSGQKIMGWQWGRKTWPTLDEMKGTDYAPTLYDGTTSGIKDIYFQSGYGDNEDLLLINVKDLHLNNQDIWSPTLMHGYYYIQKDEWYLYSDSYQSQTFSLSQTISGLQYVDMKFFPKATIPISVKQYKLDWELDRYLAALDFRKKINFSIAPSSPEFILDYQYSPPRVLLDSVYSEEIGGDVNLTVSGSAVNTDELFALEYVGRSNGEGNQVFKTEYSPLDPYGVVEVWTAQDPNWPIQWTVLSGIQDFTPNSALYEVLVDYDTGELTFGNYSFPSYSGAGKVPAPGSQIYIRYTKSLVLEYEPRNSTDYILGTSADIRPTRYQSNEGFIHLSNSVKEPGSITLNSTMSSDTNGFFIEVGNNLGLITATVKDEFGNTLEGELVTFEIGIPLSGTFSNGQQTVTALTDQNGIARAYLNSPNNIEDFSRLASGVTVVSGVSTLEVLGLQEPANLTDLVLYKLHGEDEILGIPASGLNQYYTDYLAEQGIIVDPDTTLATQAYEELFRARHDLLTPATYLNPSADLKKTLIITQKSGVMNPKTGLLDATSFSPLYPSNINNVTNLFSPDLILTYDATLDEIGTNDTAGYLAVGNIRTNITAHVRNRRNNQTVFSSPLALTYKLSDQVNGTFFCDVLNEAPDGLLTKVKNIADLTETEILSTQNYTGFSDAYINERKLINNFSEIPHSVRYRYRKLDNTISTNLTVSLVYNTTTIATWTHNDISNIKTESEQILTDAQIASIPDYQDLRFTFLVTDANDGSLNPGQAELYSAQLEVGPGSLLQDLYIDNQTAVPIKDINRGDWIASTLPVLIQSGFAKLEGFDANQANETTVTLSQAPTDGNALLVSILAYGEDDIFHGQNRFLNIACPNVTKWIKLQEAFYSADDIPGTSSTLYTYTYLAPNLNNAGTDITVSTELVPTNILGSTLVYVAEYQGISRDDALVDFTTNTGQTGSTFSSTPAVADSVQDGLFIGRVLAISGVNDFTNPTNNFIVNDTIDIRTWQSPTLLAHEFKAGFLDSVQTVSGIADFSVDGPVTVDDGLVELLTLRSALNDSDNLFTRTDDANLLIAQDLDYIESPVSGNQPAEVLLSSLSDPRILEPYYETYVDWFRRTRSGDTYTLTVAGEQLGNTNLDGLEDVDAIDCPAEIPIGFRIRSAGITIASVIDQVTYIDINDHLPEGYYDVQLDSSALGHQFKISAII